MDCTHCGSEAVVKRGEAFFCAKCAIASDWQQIIVELQDATVESPVAGMTAQTA